MTIHVRETLYRWRNWEIEDDSHELVKNSSRQIEFAVEVEPESEKVITYTAFYTW